MKIEAIETKYNGVYYRSRLEARWAIFFDEIGLPSEYEIMGMSFGDIRYLPDFFLPFDNVHVEIKPENISEKEESRLAALKDIWKNENVSGDFMIIRGVPAFGQYAIEFAGDIGTAYVFAKCRRCNGIGYLGDSGEWGYIGPHTCGDHERAPIYDDESIKAAHEKAMRTKFDHLPYKRPGKDGER